MLNKTLTITNKLGLHARASSKFIDTASRYASDITVTHHNKTANGKSIMDLMLLVAPKGSRIELTITGEDEDEDEAMKALESLINNRFGEE